MGQTLVGEEDQRAARSSPEERAPERGASRPFVPATRQQLFFFLGDYSSEGVSASAADTAVSALSAAVASGALTPAPDVGAHRQHAPMPMAMSPMAQYTMAALGDRTIEAKLLLPNARIGVVIGKGGAMINHVRETSKATLDISESGTATSERVVTFAGDFGAVYAAFSMVLQHLAASAQPMGGIDLAVPHASLRESGATVKVGAPEDVVSTDPDVRKCVVSGTIDKAFTLVVHKLEETPAGSARAPDPTVVGVYGGGVPQAGMGGSSQQIQPPLPPGAMPVQFQVPNESMGAVIGRGGSTINQIRQMSGAKVDIAQSVPGMPMRLVTVTGTPDQIQMAQYLIQVKMGGGSLPTSNYGLASSAGSNQHDYAIQQQQAMQQQHMQQLDNYGQYNQQEYQQQLQQMHQMQQQQGGYYAGF
ncbi:hypothetical protein CTAYLR_010439 [Chrysophaeum taylorii]|uniref:K Homology domain-containing protein n=1 Tax=Chrysophaeum taylorii TaxID=2483200 RepID=A0AAD7XIC7_9STRA|nr:hypothetical protein CTAYLR_010439 [Chrysophaeum taylorii]